MPSPVSPTIAKAKAMLRARLRPLDGPPPFLTPTPTAFGSLDDVKVEPSGQIVVVGWVADRQCSLDGLVTVSLDGRPLLMRSAFRFGRPDVAAALGSEHLFFGATWVFLLPSPRPSRTRVAVSVGGEPLVEGTVELPGEPPAMAQLFDGGARFEREEIYGSGPPLVTASPEVVDIAAELPSPLLDLGCGIGALVRELRARGFEATGVELDRPDIAAGIQPDVRRHIRLTEGGFPLPFEDGAFAAAVAFEVLEHIPDVEVAARELVRVARDEIVVSVPDPSAIPTLFPHGVVPWHLLEATHLHFFSVEALAALFAPEFELIGQLRLNRRQVNGTTFYDSMVLHLRRAPPPRDRSPERVSG